MEFQNKLVHRQTFDAVVALWQHYVVAFEPFVVGRKNASAENY